MPYDSRATSVVLAAKERGERHAKDLLAVGLSTALSYAQTSLDKNVWEQKISQGSHSDQSRTNEASTPFVMIPIPATKRALRTRGEDVILTLAKQAARPNGIGILPALSWRRGVRDQSRLTLRERKENLVDALMIDEGLILRWRANSPPGKSQRLRIVLVDDVITSGSTISAAISAISHSSLSAYSSLLGITACYSTRVSPLG